MSDSWVHEDKTGDGDYNYTGVVGGNTAETPTDKVVKPDRTNTRIKHYGKGRVNITPK